MLEKDCAVCKEQFKLETEDPDEQVVITLPCQHPFHEPCILPWLKSSGTCPVCRLVIYSKHLRVTVSRPCRHALVPQPEHHPLPTGSSPGPGPSPGRRGDRSPSPRNRTSRPDSPIHDGSSIFQSLFGGFVGGRGDPSRRNTGSPSRHNRSNSDPASRSSNRGSDSRHVPGSWSDDLD